MAADESDEKPKPEEPPRTKAELAEAYKLLPVFDAEAYVKKIGVSLRPLSKGHWMRKKQHKDFLRAGWRRLVRHQRNKIEVLETILRARGAGSFINIEGEMTDEALAKFLHQWELLMANSDVDVNKGAWARVVKEETARCEEEMKEREGIYTRGYYRGNTPEDGPGAFSHLEEEEDYTKDIEDALRVGALERKASEGPPGLAPCEEAELEQLNKEAPARVKDPTAELLRAPEAKAVVKPVTNDKVCSKCSDVLGERYYQAVPEHGDLCLYCHTTVFGVET